MSTDKIIIAHNGSEHKSTIQRMSNKGWKFIGSTAAGLLFVLSGNAQCLNNAIDAEFVNNEAYINQDEVLYTAQGDLWVTIGSNSGNKFELYKNGVLQGAGSISFLQGDQVRLIPKNPGIANLAIISDEPGCNNRVEDNEAMSSLPIKWLSISSYVENDELRIDAESAQAVNVDYIDMELSIDGSNFMVEDTEKATNGNTPQKYNFSVSVDELIRKYNIVKPTVFYTRLTNHDLDGQTQTSEVQAVEISPDGTVKLLMIGSNVANNADQIRFYLNGDAETVYPVRVVNQSGGQSFEAFLGGGSEYSVSDVTGLSTLHPGIYSLQAMINGIQTQKFVIVN